MRRLNRQDYLNIFYEYSSESFDGIFTIELEQDHFPTLSIERLRRYLRDAGFKTKLDGLSLKCIYKNLSWVNFN